MALDIHGSFREFSLPDLGEGVAEGEVARWFVKRGESVEEDDPIVEIVTDKTSVIISAPWPMTIEEVLFKDGEIARVGEALFRYRPRETALRAGIDPPTAQPRSTAAATDEAEPRRAEGSARPLVSMTALRAKGRDDDEGWSEGRLAEQSGPLPSVESAEAKREIVASAVGDLRQSAPGTALYEALPAERRRGERVHRASVEERLPPGLKSHARDREAAPLASRSSKERDRSEGVRVPIGTRRKTIASRMRQSRDNAVQATLVEECEMDALIGLRDELRAGAGPEALPRGSLSFLPFFLKAVAHSLVDFPRFSSRIEGDDFQLEPSLPIGVAVDTDEGLLVPVVRRAKQASIFDLARELERLSEGARAGGLPSDELRGSVFTITSLGKLGSLFGTPILNPPELGILGIHRARERPIVRGGSIAVGRIANLSLSFDHQWIDGAYAARFLCAIIERIERPALLLAE